MKRFWKAFGKLIVGICGVILVPLIVAFLLITIGAAWPLLLVILAFLLPGAIIGLIVGLKQK